MWLCVVAMAEELPGGLVPPLDAHWTDGPTRTSLTNLWEQALRKQKDASGAPVKYDGPSKIN